MKDVRTVESFETTLRTSYDWIHTFGDALGQTHGQLCYRGMRAVLHALRDRLLPETEIAPFAAQLPTLLRGVFYEGWQPNAPRPRIKSPEELYDLIAAELAGGLHASPAAIAKAAFETLNQRVDGGEIRKIRHLVPEPIRDIWPDPRAAGL